MKTEWMLALLHPPTKGVFVKPHYKGALKGVKTAVVY